MFVAIAFNEGIAIKKRPLRAVLSSGEIDELFGGLVGGSLLTGDTAKDNDVCIGVATQAVGTVSQTCYFTGGKQTWDYLALFIQHVGLGICYQTTHGVVY